jgi:hypothetical protein
MTFTFATRPVIDQEALQEATRAQFVDNNDELIGVSPERLAALAEVAATASTREDLVSAGYALIQGELEQLGDRGMQNLLDGIASGPIDVEKEFGLVDEAPHGKKLAERAQAGQDSSTANGPSGFQIAYEAARAGNRVNKLANGQGKSLACDLVATKVTLYTSLLGSPIGGTVAGVAFNEACQAATGGEGLITKVIKWFFKTENPLKDPIDSNDLIGTRDYDLKMQILKNYDPVVDPSEESAGSAIYKIIEDIEVIKGMDLYHGGTSTGSFQEEGTIRLDQSDFAGFLGSHGGTSTGGGQLI